MAGYSRQSAADIIANAIIKAAPVNAEYNALRDAFAFSGGHKHDGSSTEGAYIPLIADVDAFNKVVIDTTNNRIGFFSEVGGAAVEQVRIQDGAIVPVTDDDIDLGATGAEFKDLYIDGVGYIDTLTVHENATIAGTLNVTGVITAPGGLVADITGDITGNVTGDLTGDVTSTGTSTFADIDAVDLAATGTTVITSGDINSGTIDNSVIGNATPAAGTFTTLNANTSLTAATADINGGTVDGTTIGATTPSTGAFTALSATGTSTLTTVDINGGAIDGTVIGASGAAAGSFTTVSTSGQATLATVDINGGSIDGAIIGASTPAAITGTTVTGTSLVGPVTGNVTGNLTGNVTGNVTGDLTGNVTASSGSSTFNNVVIDGTLNMNAGTTATIQNLTAPVNDLDAATKKYVDDEVAGLVDSAPGTLDTLNELAAALGDDADFSNTVTTSIATKLPLAGGTMTGAIAMGTNKITGLGDPTAAQDAASKNYSDTTFLSLSGGTMTGAIDMGSQKITTTYTPTNAADLTTKTYVDAILGSGSDAAASAAAAATSETNAATSETNAATSETNAATSEANAAASYDNFDDRYLGAKSSAPTVDNDGDALIVGALYFNNTTNIMYVYGSGGWQAAGSSVNGTSDRNTYTATAGQTVFAATYDTGYVDVYLNGVKLVAGTDFTATNGTSITLATGAAVNDVVDIVAYGTFVLADHYTEAQSDARYVEVAGDTMTGGLNITSGNLGIGTSSPSSLIHASGAAASGGAVEIRLEDTAASSNSRLMRTGSAYSYAGVGANETWLYHAGAGTINIGPDGAGAVKIVNNGAERMRIDSSGAVVINNTGGDAQLYFGGTSGTNRMYLARSGLDSFLWNVSSGNMRFGTADTERMRLDSSGNVGIGTSSPVALSGQTSLTINGTSVGRLDLQSTGTLFGNGTNLTLQGSYAKNVVIDGGTTAGIQFQVGSSEKMRIDSSGNVNIGISSGAGTLTIASSGNTGLILRQNTASDRFKFFVGDGTGGYAVDENFISSNNTNLRFLAGGSGTSEVMQLTSSGNLLVGMTSASTNNDGAGIRADGLIHAKRADVVATFNRKTTNGTVVQIAKDNTVVGSIKSRNSESLMIGSDYGSDAYICLSNDNVFPVTSTGFVKDGATNLGVSTGRFKDLYLSGGVFLGGTGSANKLDDYEEGTWTPVIRAGSETGTIVGTTNVFASYTKIGRTCNFTLNITRSDAASLTGNLVVTGLPFTGTNTNGVAAGSFWLDNASSDYVGVLYIPPENTFFRLKDAAGPNDYTQIQEFENGRAVYLSATYTTAS